MTVTAAMIAGVISQARTIFPSRVYTLYWGEDGQHSVEAVLTEGLESAAEGSLDGAIDNTRGVLRIILSECSPWTPPGDDDQITLYQSGEKVGEYAVLRFRDDSGTRRLEIGEAEA